MNIINLNKKLVSKEGILSHIQDIDIYRFYTNQEVELKGGMLSPLMKDTKPSFGYFQGEKNEICFNDFRLGSGDCIQFVQHFFGLNYFEALSRIVIDFDLQDYFYYKQLDKDNNKKYNPDDYKSREEVLKTPTFRLGKKKRSWKAYDLAYWMQYGIDSLTLRRYRVQAIQYIFFNGENPIYADKYAYCFIENKDNINTYKIYQPFSKNYKWLNNHNSSVWQGWEQLPEKGENLIITKSLKDVMSLNCMLDIPAVALQTESSNPKSHIIDELKERFDKIYLLYDNDFDKEVNWGQEFAIKLCDKFDFTNLIIPDIFESKDFSDLVKNLDKYYKNIIFDNTEEEFKTKKQKIREIWECNIMFPF